jgi:DNA replication protein DnaC
MPPRSTILQPLASQEQGVKFDNARGADPGSDQLCARHGSRRRRLDLSPSRPERLAERARAESWSHEDYLAACLQREVAARDAHGGEGRIKTARFPAHKSLEEFDFDHAPA